MILSQLVEYLPSLKPQDQLARAQKLFEQFHTTLLAVVDKGQFKAIITISDLEKGYPEQKISDLLTDLSRDALLGEEDILVSIPFFEKYNCKFLPVIDEQKHFLGYLEFETLGNELIKSNANNQEGGIIKIQFHQQRDSFSQIIRIIEENNGFVIRSFVKEHTNENKLPLLILQVKTEQLGNIVQHLERHGFFIEQSFHLVGNENYDQSRYESLMKYLTI